MDFTDLLRAAEGAMEHAYAPYSGFRVGAALRTVSGRVFTGCNVENASYGATVCAERAAVCKAVSEGERAFTAVAVVSSSGKPTPPCGICRQVLAEFSDDMRVALMDAASGKVTVYRLGELFPEGKLPL